MITPIHHPGRRDEGRHPEQHLSSEGQSAVCRHRRIHHLGMGNTVEV